MKSFQLNEPHQVLYILFINKSCISKGDDVVLFKAARCPNCSGELILDPEEKSGSCNHCGSNIVVEEAIKKVQVDLEPSVKNFYQLAEKAYNVSNYEEAYDYYRKVLEIDSDNWEAVFKKGMSAFQLSTLAKVRLPEAINGANEAISIIENKNKDMDIELIKNNFAVEISNIIDLVANAKAKHYEDFKHLDNKEGSSGEQRTEYVNSILNIVEPGLNYCVSLISDDMANKETLYKKNKIKLLKAGIRYHKNLHGNVVFVATETSAVFNKYYEMLYKLEPESKDNPKYQQLKSSCYIATAVYGDYNAPEVKVLRSFRDEKLLKSNAGRSFVKGYYLVGPVLAKTVAMLPLLNSYVRRILNKIVKSIQD